MDKGEIVSADGWIMKWDMGCIPSQIDVWHSDIHQYTISGEINQKKLLREIKKFQKLHSGQILMEISIPTGPT